MPYTGPFGSGYTNTGSVDGIVVDNIQFNGTLGNTGTISPNGISVIHNSIINGFTTSAIQNDGTIAGGIFIDSTSQISGAAAIWISPNGNGPFSGDINNAGTITTTSYGIDLGAPVTGSVINSGTITGNSTTVGVYGVHATISGNISNSGIISAGGIGIYLLQMGGPATIVNTGTITSNVAIQTSADFVFHSTPIVQPVDIFNSGTLTGTGGIAVQLEAGGFTNTFTLGPGYHVNGGVHGAGGDIFQLGGSGSDSFDLSKIGSQYTGFATFNVVSATWTASGSGSNWNIKSGAEMDLASGGSLSATNVNGGELVIRSGASATGTTITAGGIEYVSSGGTANNVTFGDTASTLAMENPAALTGVLTNWHIGNKIDFVHTAVTSASIGNGGASLGIMTSDGHSYQYNLAGLQANTQAFIQDDGAGGTFVQLGAAPGGPAVPGSVAINDVTISEGDSGTKLANFTVTRSGGSAAFAVNFSTFNGTATTADNDYAANSGTLNFGAGATTKTISVTIKGDIKFEPNQTFTVNLSGPTNGATISDSQGVGTIANDDPNHAPQITPVSNGNITVPFPGRILSPSELFSASDLDNDSLTYFIYDWSPAASSGHFEVRGAVVPAQTVIGLTAADLTFTRFIAGASGNTDDLGVMVFDGHDYSGNTSFTPIHVNVPANRAPVVTVPSTVVSARAGQSFAAFNLFSVSDPDGSSGLVYFLFDWSPAANSGHFVVNGVVVPAQTVIGLTAAEIAQTTFVAGALGNTDDLGVMVFDGTAYSGNTSFTPIHVTVINHAPVVTVPEVNVGAHAGQTLAASSLFSISDADNDALTYFIYDWNPAPDSGHFVINGVVAAAQTVIGLTPTDLAHTSFVAGSAGATDDLGVMAFDGHEYSGNTSFNPIHVTGGINHAPVVTVPSVNATASPGQALAASDLFTVSDADNDALTYFIYDWSPATDSGHFVVNGAVVPAQTVIGLTAADIAHTTFVAGALGVTDDLGVMAYDGFDYSGNTSFNPIHVTAVNHAPAVSIPQVNVAASAGQVFAASSLFSVTDADHDALTYFIYDWSPAAGSGHFEVNGAVMPSQTVIGLTASDLAHTTFVAGSAGAVDDLGVMAFDGHDYSSNTSFNDFHIFV